jgi:ATP-dependent Zn protease
METDLIKSMSRIAILCAVVLCLAGLLWMAAGTGGGQSNLTYSQFLEQVRAGQVASVTIIASNSGVTPATCRLKDGNTVRTVLPSDYRDALAAMQDKLVNIEIQDSSSGRLRLLTNATPFFLLLALWVVLAVCKFPIGPTRFIGQ